MRLSLCIPFIFIPSFNSKGAAILSLNLQYSPLVEIFKDLENECLHISTSYPSLKVIPNIEKLKEIQCTNIKGIQNTTIFYNMYSWFEECLEVTRSRTTKTFES